MLVSIISALVIAFISIIVADITNDVCQAVLYPRPTIINIPVIMSTLQEIIAEQVEETRIAKFETVQAEIEALVSAEADTLDSVEELDYSVIGRERFVQSLPSYKVTQLKELAKYRNIDKVYKLNKAQLILALT